MSVSIRDAVIRAQAALAAPRWWFGPAPLDFLWFQTKNWGDALNPVLISALSGRPARGIDIAAQYPALRGRDKATPTYVVIGSVLQHADRNAVVWGAGFMSATARTHEPPRRVCAVRGPLTRDRLLAQGVECPAIYGDPAALFTRIYSPPRTTRHRLGLIPHYADRASPAIRALARESEVLVIDIKSGIRAVVDAICSCERIASTSLHGLIMADAYGIPSIWIEVGDQVLGAGFKFQDYFASVGRADAEPIDLNSGIGRAALESACRVSPAPIDLDRLLAACPFAAP